MLGVDAMRMRPELRKKWFRSVNQGLGKDGVSGPNPVLCRVWRTVQASVLIVLIFWSCLTLSQWAERSSPQGSRLSRAGARFLCK